MLIDASFRAFNYPIQLSIGPMIGGKKSYSLEMRMSSDLICE